MNDLLFLNFKALQNNLQRLYLLAGSAISLLILRLQFLNLHLQLHLKNLTLHLLLIGLLLGLSRNQIWIGWWRSGRLPKQSLRIDSCNSHNARINRDRIVKIGRSLLQGLDHNRLGNAMHAGWIVRVGYRNQIIIIQRLQKLLFLPANSGFLVVPPECFRVFLKAILEKLEFLTLCSRQSLMDGIHCLGGLLNQRQRSSDRSILLTLSDAHFSRAADALT